MGFVIPRRFAETSAVTTLRAPLAGEATQLGLYRVHSIRLAGHRVDDLEHFWATILGFTLAKGYLRTAGGPRAVLVTPIGQQNPSRQDKLLNFYQNKNTSSAKSAKFSAFHTGAP
jgi:hypothetical protein